MTDTTPAVWIDKAEALWVIQHGKWALYALAIMGAVIAWRMM